MYKSDVEEGDTSARDIGTAEMIHRAGVSRQRRGRRRQGGSGVRGGLGTGTRGHCFGIIGDSDAVQDTIVVGTRNPLLGWCSLRRFQ